VADRGGSQVIHRRGVDNDQGRVAPDGSGATFGWSLLARFQSHCPAGIFWPVGVGHSVEECLTVWHVRTGEEPSLIMAIDEAEALCDALATKHHALIEVQFASACGPFFLCHIFHSVHLPPPFVVHAYTLQGSQPDSTVTFVTSSTRDRRHIRSTSTCDLRHTCSTCDARHIDSICDLRHTNACSIQFPQPVDNLWISFPHPVDKPVDKVIPTSLWISLWISLASPASRLSQRDYQSSESKSPP